MSMEESFLHPDEDSRDRLISIEAEQMVLGCILMHNESLWQVGRILEKDDFSEGLHQRIYERASKIINNGGTASPLTLGNYFSNDPAMNDVGIGYLATLAANSVSSSTVTDYAKHLRNLGLRRRIFDRSQRAIKDALHADIDVSAETILEEFQNDLDEILGLGGAQGSVSMSEAVDRAVAEIERAYKSHGMGDALSTGIPSLDEAIGGLRPGNLIFIGARPAQGKSALAGTIVFNAAKRMGEGESALVFSLEMSAVEIAQRGIARETGISAQDQEMGRIDDRKYRLISDKAVHLVGLPIWIDDTGGLNINQICSRARQHKRRHGLSLLVVDHLHLMDLVGGNRNTTSTDLIGLITRKLKALAKELNVPVIALAQLNRSLETRADKRPMLADLRQSGSIEQDADRIIFLHREYEYLKRERPETSDDINKHAEALRYWEDKAEVIVAKYRQGKTGSLILHFDGPTTTFGERE